MSLPLASGSKIGHKLIIKCSKYASLWGLPNLMPPCNTQLSRLEDSQVTQHLADGGVLNSATHTAIGVVRCRWAVLSALYLSAAGADKGGGALVQHRVLAGAGAK